MTIRALLFDVDDTLYDFSKTWETATRALLEELLAPYSISVNEVWDKFVRFDETVFSYVNSGEIPSAVARRLRWQFLETVWDISIPNLPNLLIRHTEAMRHQCVPYDDTIRTIAALSRQYRLAIVTNGPSDFLDDRLTSVGLSPYFPSHLRIAADAVSSYKPEPEIFQEALRRLALPARDCLFIGDSWNYDVMGAKAAHIPVIWYNPRRLQCPDPAAIVGEISTLNELDHLLTTMED